MKVVIHKAVSNNGDLTAFRFFFNVFQKKFIICVIAKNIIVMHTTIIDMIIIVWEKDCFSSSHTSPTNGWQGVRRT
jgi:hypothetical protein